MIGSDTDVWPTLVRLDSAGTPSAPVSLLSSVATSGASTAAICVRVPASVLRLPPALLSAAITDDTGRSAPLPVALVRGRPLTAVCSADVMVLLRLVVRPALVRMLGRRAASPVMPPPRLHVGSAPLTLTVPSTLATGWNARIGFVW